MYVHTRVFTRAYYLSLFCVDTNVVLPRELLVRERSALNAGNDTKRSRVGCTWYVALGKSISSTNPCIRLWHVGDEIMRYYYYCNNRLTRDYLRATLLPLTGAST